MALVPVHVGPNPQRFSSDGIPRPTEEQIKDRYLKKWAHHLSIHDRDLCSISVGWDNYQMLSQARVHHTSHGNEFLKFGMTFTVKHRTLSLHLDDNIGHEATSIPRRKYLPDHNELVTIKERCTVIVARILVDYLPALQHLHNKVPKHFPHKYSDEMREKSEVLNLGVVNADPASNAGVLQIMEHIHSACPTNHDTILWIPCNGDQSSMERMTNLKRAKVREETPQQQLAGLVETPQEFHKEGVLLQVSIILHNSSQ